MIRYYELSTSKYQSREQLELLNELVQKIRDEARRYRWEFDNEKFDGKKIRDRVRSFYKTNIQNAKKQLKTMLRNPDKRANIKALAAHFHLIEDKAGDEEGNNHEDYDNGSHLKRGTKQHEFVSVNEESRYAVCGGGGGKLSIIHSCTIQLSSDMRCCCDKLYRNTYLRLII